MGPGTVSPMTQLQRAFHAAQDGAGLQLIRVTGEAGIGKSTLLLQFQTWIESTAAEEAYVGYGRAWSDSFTEPFLPIRQALQGVASRTKASRSKTLGRFIREIAPAWLAVIPVAGSAVSALFVTADAALDKPGALPQGTTFGASVIAQFTELIGKLSEDGVVALLLDDLHWADASTADLVGHLAQELQDSRTLLVLSYRPADLEISDDPPPFKRAIAQLGRYVTPIDVILGRRSKDELRALLGDALGTDVDEILLSELQRRSDGNPLAALTLLGLLEDRGLIRKSGTDMWLADTDVSQLDVPSQLSSVFDERLLAVTEDQRHVLDVAAVLGASFTPSTVQQVAGVADVMPLLRGIRRRFGLIEAVHVNGEDRYSFFHGLLREHLLERLRSEDQVEYRSINRACAAMLESEPKQDDFSWLSRMAWHTAESDHPDAFVYAQLCADAARTSESLAEALRYASWAVDASDLHGNLADRIDARLFLGEMQWDTLRLAPSWATYAEAAELAEPGAHEDPGRLVVALLGQAGALSAIRAWPACEEVLEHAAQFESRVSTECRVRWRLLSSSTHMFGPGDVQIARRLLAEADEMVQQAEQAAAVKRHLAVLRLAADGLQPAIELIRAARSLAEEAQDPGTIFQTVLFEVYIHVAVLDLASAQNALRQLAEIAASNSIRPMDVHRLGGRIFGLAGDAVQASRHYCRFLDIDLRLDARTQVWALTHFILDVAEFVRECGESLARAVIEELIENVDAMDQELVVNGVPFANRLRDLCTRVDEAATTASLEMLGLDEGLDATAERVHEIFINDLDSFRRRLGVRTSATR